MPGQTQMSMPGSALHLGEAAQHARQREAAAVQAELLQPTRAPQPVACNERGIHSKRRQGVGAAG